MKDGQIRISSFVILLGYILISAVRTKMIPYYLGNSLIMIDSHSYGLNTRSQHLAPPLKSPRFQSEKLNDIGSNEFSIDVHQETNRIPLINEKKGEQYIALNVVSPILVTDFPSVEEENDVEADVEVLLRDDIAEGYILKELDEKHKGNPKLSPIIVSKKTLGQLDSVPPNIKRLSKVKSGNEHQTVEDSSFANIENKLNDNSPTKSDFSNGERDIGMENTSNNEELHSFNKNSKFTQLAKLMKQKETTIKTKDVGEKNIIFIPLPQNILQSIKEQKVVNQNMRTKSQKDDLKEFTQSTKLSISEETPKSSESKKIENDQHTQITSTNYQEKAFHQKESHQKNAKPNLLEKTYKLNPHSFSNVSQKPKIDVKKIIIPGKDGKFRTTLFYIHPSKSKDEV